VEAVPAPPARPFFAAAFRLAVCADEGLCLRQLVDDDIALGSFDDPLDLRVLMAGDDDEAVVVGAHVLVLGSGQGEEPVAGGVPALAPELEQLVIGHDLEPLADLLNPVVHLPKEGFVLCRALLSRIHRHDCRQQTAAFTAVVVIDALMLE
jgi:hypothetical protein